MLFILHVLLDSHFRGNEEVGQNMSFSDSLFRGNEATRDNFDIPVKTGNVNPAKYCFFWIPA